MSDNDDASVMDEETAARFYGTPRFGSSGGDAMGHMLRFSSGEGGAGGNGRSPGGDDFKEGGRGEGDDDDADEEAELYEPDPEPVSLPTSTHSIFFTQPVFSIPFLFATCITVICVMSLSMALLNNLETGGPGNLMGVPANVSRAVKIAQYLAILITLIMEEEIPTAVHLLRCIPQPAFKKRFPSKSYGMFVASALLRIALGYLFLANVYLTIVQSTAVIDIFFNVLALQFISELDDIAFELCKMEVLGRRLARACTAKLYQTEFEKQKFRRNLAASIFLKTAYFINLAVFVYFMTIVTMRQQNGDYQCQSVSIDFGDTVWEDPVVKYQGEMVPGFTMVFSYFNGVYTQLNKETSANRPVYTEMKKLNSDEPFDKDVVEPAKIKYSPAVNAWILVHPYIRRSFDDQSDEPWLLRSPDTDSFELLDVSGSEWDLWQGRIESAVLHISCNECDDDTDCNLNGKCYGGKCECDDDSEAGIRYLGTHCEVKMEDKCGTIESEIVVGNMTEPVKYSISHYANDGTGPRDTLFQEYSRPVYEYVSGLPDVKEGEINWLVYTGRRWFGLNLNLIESNITFEELLYGTANFHAFWSNAYSEATTFVSDPTTGDNPVGVDFYLKGEVNTEENNQFGPFGALYPAQKDGQVGRGFWHCAGPEHLEWYDDNATDANAYVNTTTDINANATEQGPGN